MFESHENMVMGAAILTKSLTLGTCLACGAATNMMSFWHVWQLCILCHSGMRDSYVRYVILACVTAMYICHSGMCDSYIHYFILACDSYVHYVILARVTAMYLMSFWHVWWLCTLCHSGMCDSYVPYVTLACVTAMYFMYSYAANQCGCTGCLTYLCACDRWARRGVRRNSVAVQAGAASSRPPAPQPVHLELPSTRGFEPSKVVALAPSLWAALWPSRCWHWWGVLSW